MTDKLSKNEGIKTDSNFLRGTLAEGLQDHSAGSVSEDDTQLTKFHGIYQQDDRDLRPNRRKKKLDKAYSFMIRVRVPGGVCSPYQWLEMDRISDTFANGTIKLTTRQAFQFHGVIKTVLKRTMQEINETLLDTLAACGDVNRNVMCNPNPHQSHIHAKALKLADDISEHLTPATSAYHEIWLDGEKFTSTEAEEEPIYGKTYLPRKFKTVIAVPPSNDVDIFAHCLGYIAIVENDELVGYNVTVGGGMGMTHGDTETFPRTADVMAFCTPEQAVDVAEKVVLVQRDHGNRVERKNARLKYTVETHGVDWFREQVEERLGYKLEDARPFAFDDTGDRYGWVKGEDGTYHVTLFIQNGRVLDTDDFKMKTGLRKIAEIHKGDFRLTANQNVIIGSVSEEERPKIEALLKEYKLDAFDQSGLRRSSMACVSLPTCGLALAESERYLPDLVTELETELESLGLRENDIIIRMTGCPNGCARPYLAEIGLVGKNPGRYNLYLGAAFNGERLNKLYRENLDQNEVLPTLSPMFKAYAKEREAGEHFGDFVIRKGIIKATPVGNQFHADIDTESVFAYA